jgi:hypothetical protein
MRWIELDVNNPDYVFAAIEAGALVKSHDGGRTRIDRVEGGVLYDTHTLATHQKMPKRVYFSAGDRYLEALITESHRRGLHQRGLSIIVTTSMALPLFQETLKMLDTYSYYTSKQQL